MLHADPGYPAIVGDKCVIGHKAIVLSALVWILYPSVSALKSAAVCSAPTTER